MYLQNKEKKIGIFVFVDVLKVTDENSRIRIQIPDPQHWRAGLQIRICICLYYWIRSVFEIRIRISNTDPDKSMPFVTENFSHAKNTSLGIRIYGRVRIRICSVVIYTIYSLKIRFVDTLRDFKFY
jgi:hypothetical protein